MKVFNVDDVAAKWSHTEKLAPLILWRRHSEIFELIKPVHVMRVCQASRYYFNKKFTMHFQPTFSFSKFE